ncbi:glycosyl hydrolase family 28-related protein [Paraburkholderia phenazinium]|uniref:Pectate lyase superfamily protein n=1 Tax=Paraburkholderia phenazinium TaxID=60549 RepID=A0A1N6KPG7_9BURK|nr:glycosyl hydrolase family 28-related protein [Paraburkholderia phenazinium]SIO58425.1 Pectate lyase superfamily protein [Paraburkholderia phenazinium]
MTISTTSNTTVAQGNGLTTSFNYSFPVPAASELNVSYTDINGNVTELSPSTYSVTGIGTSNGGAVTYPLTGSPIASGTSLTIQREVPYVQLTDLVNQSGYYPSVVEAALDYLTMQTQQLAEQTQLSLQVPLASTPANLVYPPAAARANMLAGFDSNGNAAAYPVTASVGAGNLTIEGPFIAGVNFTAGVSNSVTLSQSYGSKANLGTVVMAGIAQSPDTYSLAGNVLAFNAVIPVGVDKIWCIGGTTLSLDVPPNGTVGDAQLAWGNILARVCDSVSALAALNPTTYTRAFATGYYAAGDGGGGPYYYSSTTSQALANGGTIIASGVGSGCWLMEVGAGGVSVRQFGAKGDGATDDTAAIQAAENSGISPLHFDFGTFIVNTTGVTKKSNVDWIGSQNGLSSIKAISGAFGSSSGIVNGTSISGFKISNITFDFTAATGNLGLLNFSLVNNYAVEGCVFLGNFKFAISHNGGNRFTFRTNQFLRTTASSSQNQGLLVSTSAGPCLNGLIEANYHNNTGMDISAQYTTIAYNQTYNWQFGAGITIEQNNNCSDLKIIGNISSGGSGTDVNNTVCLGIENWAPRTAIAFNTCAGNAGDGIANGGQNCVISANTCLNNGQVSGNGITTRYTSSSINGNYSTVFGNNCIDTQGTPTQNYGYADYNSSVYGVNVGINTFSGNKIGPQNILGTTAVLTPSFQAYTTFNPSSISNGASAGGTLTCNGAEPNDFAQASFQQSLQGVKLFAWVSAANSVSFRFENNTGGTVIFSTAQISVSVTKAINYPNY